VKSAKGGKASDRQIGRYQAGERSRAKIIAAAIEVFAQHGRQSASTRMIAARAKVNLGALKYYFGGKEELYLACADHIASQVEPRLDALESGLARLLPSGDAGPEAYLKTLEKVVDLAADAIVFGEKNADWMMFITREQLSPGPAFEVLYQKVLTRLIALLSTLVSRVIGRPPRSEQTVLSTFVLMGPLFIFQRARSVALRALEWRELDAPKMERLKAILVRQALYGLRSDQERPDD
jgi:TetR/AcrR family transcriptional regulator, regulator of cefoperazone and chloramphenicol sensitivity